MKKNPLEQLNVISVIPVFNCPHATVIIPITVWDGVTTFTQLFSFGEVGKSALCFVFFVALLYPLESHLFLTFRF